MPDPITEHWPHPELTRTYRQAVGYNFYCSKCRRVFSVRKNARQHEQKNPNHFIGYIEVRP